MNNKAMYKLSYGLFVLTAKKIKSASLSISHRLNKLFKQKFRGIFGDFNGNIIDGYDYGR